jgi:hypothetical protein
VSDESEAKEGYTLGTLPASSAAIWQGNILDLFYTSSSTSFEIKDPIQIAVGYKRCREKMLAYAKEHDLKTDTFVEIYSSNNSSYFFLQ